jgi:hypothetical protein
MSSILNRSQAKRFVLARFKEMRSGSPMTRVSKEYLDDLERWLKDKISRDIQRHPSIGVTFKP